MKSSIVSLLKILFGDADGVITMKMGRLRKIMMNLDKKNMI